MTLRWKYTPFTLPLLAPLRLASSNIHHRSGFLLTFTDPQGLHVHGEISPLPGFHKEQLHQLLPQLQQYQASCPLLHLDEEDALQALWDIQEPFPSVRFGFEMAQHTRRFFSSNTDLDATSSTSTSTLQVQALLTTDQFDLTQAHKKIKQGFKTFKIKVGQRPIQEEIDFLKRLRQEFGQAPRLRLDANRSWDLTHALEFGSAVGFADIDYIEEPCHTWEDCERFRDRTGISIALDESLVLRLPPAPEEEDLLAQLKPTTIILKPSWLGLQDTLSWSQWAQAHQIEINISSMFETGLGRAFLACWTAGLKTSLHNAHGLDTGGWFASDLIDKPFPLERGEIDLHKARACLFSVDLSQAGTQSPPEEEPLT